MSKYFGLPFPAALFFIFYRNRGIFRAFRREQPQIHSRMRNKNGKLTGYVDHIVFQNSENGYTVMILMTEGEEVTCVGMCKGLGQGENITAEGSI